MDPLGQGRAWGRRVLGRDTAQRVASATRRAETQARYDALRLLGTPPPFDPELGFAPQEHRVFSQNGEDGILQAIFRIVGAGGRRFLEFGIQEGREGNAVLLADVFGWSGTFIEGDEAPYAALRAKYAHSPRVATVRAMVGADNINRLVGSEPLDLLSIDVDGDDFWIWNALESSPRVVVVEYNASLGLDPVVQPPDLGRGWDETAAFGASLPALERLGRKKRYRLVHCDLAGVNAFFVRDDIAGSMRALTAEQAFRAPNYGLEGRCHPPGPSLEWYGVAPDGVAAPR